MFDNFFPAPIPVSHPQKNSSLLKMLGWFLPEHAASVLTLNCNSNAAALPSDFPPDLLALAPPLTLTKH